MDSLDIVKNLFGYHIFRESPAMVNIFSFVISVKDINLQDLITAENVTGTLLYRL